MLGDSERTRQRILDDGAIVLEFVSPPTAEELAELFPIPTKGGSWLSPDGEGLGLTEDGVHIVYPPEYMAEMRQEATEFIFSNMTTSRKHPLMAKFHAILAGTAPKKRKDRKRIFAIWDATRQPLQRRSEEYRLDPDFVERIAQSVATLRELADVCRPPDPDSLEAQEIDRTVRRWQEVADEATSAEFLSRTFSTQDEADAADLSVVHAYYLSRANIAHQVAQWQQRQPNRRKAYRRAPGADEVPTSSGSSAGYELWRGEMANVLGCEKAYRSSLPMDVANDLLDRSLTYVGPFTWYPIDFSSSRRLRPEPSTFD